MKHRLSLLIALSGCSLLFAKGPHVPSAYEGTTEITVVNAWDHKLCAFGMTQHNDEPLDNWLGEAIKRKDIAPGARTTFKITPGVYHVIAGFCDNGGQAIAASGTYGAATTTIEGPTVIALGPNPVDPMAGADMRAFPKLY